MNVNAPKSFIDMVHLLVPKLAGLCKVDCPISIIDTYKGDELIRGYFDRQVGIVLYVNRIFNYNASYDRNKMELVITFIHEAIHSKRGFSSMDEESKYFKYKDYMKLYELDCQIVTLLKLDELKPVLIAHPYNLDETKYDEVLMDYKLKCLRKYYFIISKSTNKEQDKYLINQISRNMYVKTKMDEILKSLDYLKGMIMQGLPGFGSHKQYEGDKSGITYNALPVTNIGVSLGSVKDEN